MKILKLFQLMSRVAFNLCLCLKMRQVFVLLWITCSWRSLLASSTAENIALIEENFENMMEILNKALGKITIAVLDNQNMLKQQEITMNAIIQEQTYLKDMLRYISSKQKSSSERANIMELMTLLANYKNDIDKNFPHILKLAHDMNVLEHDGFPEGNKPTWRSLKGQVPKIVRLILSHEGVCLKNMWCNYAYPYLHSNRNVNPDHKLFVPKGSPTVGSKWAFETDDGEHFYIKNLYSDEYLYATDETYSTNMWAKKPQVAPKQDADNFRWILESTHSGTQFTIRNTRFHDSLSIYDDIGQETDRYFLKISSIGDPWTIEAC